MKNTNTFLWLTLAACILLGACNESNDDNTNSIDGKSGVLLVTFGSSYGYYDGEDTSPYKYQKPKETFDNILKIFKDSFPDEEIRMSYTSAFILNKLRKDEKADLDFPNAALKNMAAEGYDEITIQSLHIIPGAEYNEMMTLVDEFKKSYPKVSVKVGAPLLSSNADLLLVAEFIVNHYKTILDNNEAVVLMGHGNEKHIAYNEYYKQLQQVINSHYPTYKLFIGTVEGEPGIAQIIESLQSIVVANQKVTLAPLMSIAGDHANNDMASEEPDSWKTALENAGYTVVPELVGLGAYSDIVNLWVDHKKQAN